MKTILKAGFVLSMALCASASLFAQTQLSGGKRQVTEQDQAVAAIEDEADLRRRAAEAETSKDWPRLTAVLRRLASIRPHSPGYQYELAAAYARADDKSGGYDALLSLQRSGMAYDLAGDARLANLHGTQVWDYLVELNEQAMKPFGSGEVAFQLPAEDRLLESIAYDSGSDTFLFGSARDGIIYRRGKDGKLAVWARPQGEHWRAIMSLVVDPKGKFVWATSAGIPHFKGFEASQAGRSALLKINLADGKLAASYPAPEDGLPHLFNTVAVSSKGLVVVAEGMRGQLFKLDGEALAPLMAVRQLNALRGLAFSPDGQTLYFADHERGLFGMDLAKRIAFDVAGTDSMFLSGIEGMYEYEGQLVVIQNTLRPQRVTRLTLAEDGKRVQLAVPLEAAQSAFATPTVGVLKGSELYYIANTQRDYYDGFGLRKGNRELPPVTVFKTDARFNWDYQTPKLPPGVQGG